ncbi:MAG TPA: nitric-oxide reductase large subunit, partial [Candidatus Aminicenantes bacterium]|nr:nitric-oxide reductase large subunit [Candidatus Aminicenantes bacterium]
MKGLKYGAILSFVVALAVLLAGGFFAARQVAPVPDRVVADGRVLATGADILAGQDVYQRYGLMDHGSVWGHGTYRGMDFSAATLHGLGADMREFLARERGSSYDALPEADRSAVDGRVIGLIKANSYDPGTGTLSLSAAHAEAYAKAAARWKSVFRRGDPSYGFLPETVRSDEEAEKLAAFFFWTAWAAGTNRPGLDHTYTNNWPPDRSVGNTLSADAYLWSVLSIVFLFVVLGLVVYVVHRYRFFYGESRSVEAGRRLLELPLTPSQARAAKFFLVVILLFLLQTAMGGLL